MNPTVNSHITKLKTCIKELEYCVENIETEYKAEIDKIEQEKNSMVTEGLVFSFHNYPNELLAPGLTTNVKLFFFKYRQTLSTILKLFKLLEKTLLVENSNQMVDGSRDGKFGKWVSAFYSKNFEFKREVEEYILRIEKPLLVSYAIRNELKERDDFHIIKLNDDDLYFQIEIGNRLKDSSVGQKLFEIWNRSRPADKQNNYHSIKFTLMDIKSTLIIMRDLSIIINNALKISA